MSWIYTVIFAGLMMTSQGGDTALTQSEYFDAEDVAIEYAVALSDEKETFEQTYPLAANGRVRVSNVNGSITIGVWDRNEVKVEYVKTADTRERLAAVDVRIETRNDAISIETDYEKWKQQGRENWRQGSKLVVDIKLTVPRGANLNEIETVNGSINIFDIANFAKVSAVNGTITAKGLRGTARLSTVNGEVNADFEQLDPSSRITLETVNGRVNLVLPSDSNATIKADSVNGSISNDFGLPVRKGKYVGRDLHGRIGNGDVQVKLTSVNGVLAIRRKADGRQLPATVNLLPSQTDDGSVEYQLPDGEVMVAAPRSPARPPVPPRPARTSVSAAAARAEISKAQREAAIARESARMEVEALRIAAETLNNEAVQSAIRSSVAAGMATAYGNASGSTGTPMVVKRENTFTVNGKPTISVKAKNCVVVVRGGSGDSVKYRVTRVSASPQENDVRVVEKLQGTMIDLEVKTADDDLRNRYYDLSAAARVEISVPRQADLDIRTSGEIRVENVTGKMDLTGSEGNFDLRDTEGDINLRTTEGRIRVIGHRGNVEARSADGEITLDGDFKRIDARSSDGDVNIILPANASANIESTGSPIELSGFTASRSDESGEKLTIGSGRDQFQIRTGGAIRVRSRDSVSVTYN